MNTATAKTMHPAEAKAAELDKPNEYKKPGMVYQVWQDGEITSQKCGELWKQRNLHQTYPPVQDRHYDLVFPHESGCTGNTFAFMANIEDALTIRNLVKLNPEEKDAYEESMDNFFKTIRGE